MGSTTYLSLGVWIMLVLRAKQTFGGDVGEDPFSPLKIRDVLKGRLVEPAFKYKRDLTAGNG